MIARYLNDPKKGISVPLGCYLRSAFPMLEHEERAGPGLVPTQNPALSNHRCIDRPMFRSVKPMPLPSCRAASSKLAQSVWAVVRQTPRWRRPLGIPVMSWPALPGTLSRSG